MPRLIRIITRLNLGGPARQIEALTPRLRAMGYETAILCGAPEPREGDLEDALRASGASVERVPELQREVGFREERRARRALRTALERLQPDLVHTHTAKAGWHGRAVAHELGIPCVHTFHGHLLHGYFGAWKQLAYRVVERRAVRKSAASICVSERVREELLRAGIVEAAKTCVIRPGLELARFDDAARAPLLEAPPVRLLFVGRLVPVKRPLAFVELVASLFAQGVDVSATLLGDGPLREAVDERIAVLHLRERCAIAQPVLDPAPIFAACDMVVNTSANEGLPLAVIEAQACSRAVLATDVGGTAEAIEHGSTGWLVAPEDPRALLEAALLVLRNREAARAVAAQGRTSARKRFGAERSAREHRELYDRVLAEHPR